MGGGAADATAGTWGLLLMGTARTYEEMLDADCSQLAGGAADGSAETNAGCGDDNTFYSTLDRIDSGEVPIRVMAEIL